MSGDVMRRTCHSPTPAPPHLAAVGAWRATAAWHEVISSSLHHHLPSSQVSAMAGIDEHLLRRWLASHRPAGPVQWGTDDDIAYVPLARPDERPGDMTNSRHHRWFLVLRRDLSDRHWVVHTLSRGIPEEA